MKQVSLLNKLIKKMLGAGCWVLGAGFIWIQHENNPVAFHRLPSTFSPDEAAI